jgi:ubiquitin carboxyl-terminal hydrolase 9/24
VLSEWIISKKVLSLAVEGNIDQSQYCDKIKTIVEFIGDQIKDEEISALWAMQYNKSVSIIDNLYVIIGIAATKFSPEQLDYLLAQVIQTWNNNQFKLHDKLVGLLRIIGREAKTNKTCSRILEALWELKNRPGLTRQLLLLIYSEHLNVLSGGRLPRDVAKREYLKKCCDDIKRAPGSSIAIASLKHMYEILNSYQKNSNKALKDALADLVVPIMKNLCTSLLKCHSNAYERATDSNQMFDQSALIDDLFTHEEVVQTHLNSMKFILQEGWFSVLVFFSLGVYCRWSMKWAK